MVLWRRLVLRIISRPDSYFFGSIRYIYWVTATFGKAIITLPSLFRSSPMWIIFLSTATKIPVNWQQNDPCIAQWAVLLWSSTMSKAASLYSLIQHTYDLAFFPVSYNLSRIWDKKVIRDSYCYIALNKSISPFCQVQLVALKRSKTVCQITVIRVVSRYCICLTNRPIHQPACSLVPGL